MRRRLVAVLAAAATLVTTPVASSVDLPALDTPKKQMLYVVGAHVDDEIDGWSFIETRTPADYLVFITVTRGRTTEYCKTKEEAEAGWDTAWDRTYEEGFILRDQEGVDRNGPYGYQGPGSPVGEPDRGEWVYGEPWQGLGSEACGDARVASWLRFLDGMAALTPSVPSMGIGDEPWADDDYQGEFCPPGQWDGDSRLALKQTGCVEVWADENGARLALDLPEMPGWDDGFTPPGRFTVQDVADALQVVRAKRAEWGIPTLPEAGVLSVASFADFWGENAPPLCQNYNHPEHRAVAEAIRFIDLGAGPQYGTVACDQHPWLQGAETVVAVQSAQTTIGANVVTPVPHVPVEEGSHGDTEERIGPYVKYYGWLLPTYEFDSSNVFYWKVFG